MKRLCLLLLLVASLLVFAVGAQAEVTPGYPKDTGAEKNHCGKFADHEG